MKKVRIIKQPRIEENVKNTDVIKIGNHLIKGINISSLISDKSSAGIVELKTKNGLMFKKTYFNRIIHDNGIEYILEKH